MKSYGQMAEWLKATDCKSVLSRVRRFETYSAHYIHRSFNEGGSSLYLDILPAEVAHLVER